MYGEYRFEGYFERFFLCVCVCVCLFLCVLTAFQACEALFNAFLERQVFTQISDVVHAVGLSW